MSRKIVFNSCYGRRQEIENKEWETVENSLQSGKQTETEGSKQRGKKKTHTHTETGGSKHRERKKTETGGSKQSLKNRRRQEVSNKERKTDEDRS